VRLLESLEAARVAGVVGAVGGSLEAVVVIMRSHFGTRHFGGVTLAESLWHQAVLRDTLLPTCRCYQIRAMSRFANC